MIPTRYQYLLLLRDYEVLSRISPVFRSYSSSCSCFSSIFLIIHFYDFMNIQLWKSELIRIWYNIINSGLGYSNWYPTGDCILWLLRRYSIHFHFPFHKIYRSTCTFHLDKRIIRKEHIHKDIHHNYKVSRYNIWTIQR